MFPVLFSVGKIPISSFGVFLVAGLLFGLFLIWRLARAWDLDEEKVLDITLLGLLGGLLGARLLFVVRHWEFFLTHPFWSLLIFKAPGFILWGGIAGGLVTLYLLTRRKRDFFLQALDIASVGVIGGLILSDLGCFLGGCSIGVTNNLFFSVNMVGALGKRFPVQALEAILLLLALKRIWSLVTHFHQRGKILSLSLIYIGLIKLLLEPLKQTHDEGIFLYFFLIFAGILIFYKVAKRNLKADLKNLSISLYKIFTDPLTRKHFMVRLKKYWYNQKTSISWKFKNFKKGLRRFNVRLSYKNNKLY